MKPYDVLIAAITRVRENPNLTNEQAAEIVDEATGYTAMIVALRQIRVVAVDIDTAARAATERAMGRL